MRTEAIDGRIIDCHVHLVGDGEPYPYGPRPAYPPRHAALGELVVMHDRWQIDRAVLVQVSVHGTDNSPMLDALRQSGGRYRGVAVVDDAPADAVLASRTFEIVRILEEQIVLGWLMPREQMVEDRLTA